MIREVNIDMHAKDAVQTFLNYINLKKENIEFIPETSNRGLILDEDDEKVVIFVYPISHEANDSKNFFDTRDSGAREHRVAWEYALAKDLKYFCVAVHDEVDRYKDYIFSLESNESIITTLSGTLGGKRNGLGTQVVIPNDFAPKKNIERIKTKNNLNITAVHKEAFFNYLKVFDNRTYTNEYDIETLESFSQIESHYEEFDLSEEFTRYLRTVDKIEESTAKTYVGSLRGKLFNEIKEDVGDIYIYSISSINKFYEVIKKLNSSFKYEQINEKYHRTISSALKKYEKFLNWRNKPLRNKPQINKPHQRIFFGAPGTGKSYELNKEAKEYFGNNYERVTFHPNYMYGNFVGAFKPFSKVLKNSDGTIKKDEEGNIQESITYEYIPGVLMRQLVRALKCPTQDYLLLIEEINRANVAAVFGDVFQLLDRDVSGESEYFIATSKELQEFLKKEFDDCELEKNIKEKLGEDFGRLYLPNNLYIWATMNSADQGVMPMDTAFRRRWEFRYLGIDDAAESNKEDFERYKFKINSSEVVNWDLFRRELNKKLSSLNIPEDKLIGPYFVSKAILEDSNLDSLTETIKNKVLMYLYEDAAKAYRPSLFAEGKYATYSSVCKQFDENALNLFKGNIEIETQSIETIQTYDYRETDEISITTKDGVEYES